MPAPEFIRCSDGVHACGAPRGFHPRFYCNAVQIVLRFSLRTSQLTCGRSCRKILNMTNRMALSLAQADPEVAAAVDHETLRQHEGLEMIASENFVSEAVLEAAGSVFTNKYAEGYPGRRYYGGCEYADVVENLARDRAKQIFGAEHANVQPHSGSQANAAAYMAVLQTGDTILGLDLAHGGHLTHGHKLSFSGKLYRTTFYTVRRDTELIDYDELEAIAEREKPKVLIGGGSAYPRLWDFARMRQIADKVGATYVFDMAHIAGLVAGGVHPSPVPHAHITTTTTHKTLRGPRAGLILCGKDYQVGAKPEQTIGKAVDQAVFPGQQGGPLVHIVAAKAVAFGEALRPEFKTYAAQIVANAKVLGEALSAAGFRIVSGGTDNHLLLVDVFEKGILGSEAELALGKAGITVNKNAIPYDTNPPLKPSGIRVGTPALTTRGMKEAEMRQIGAWIAKALERRNDDATLERMRGEVAEMANQFPLYAWRRAPAAVVA
jgi:glycine hydroxymethyltransferase